MSVAAFLRIAGATRAGPADALYVVPLTVFAQMCGMPIGAQLERAIGPAKTCAAGAVVLASGVILASFATSLAPFLVGYSLLYGLGIGLTCASNGPRACAPRPRRASIQGSDQLRAACSNPVARRRRAHRRQLAVVP